MIVLDTNVLSELMKPYPAPSVIDWMANEPASGLYTTTPTQAEILYGIALLAPGRRRDTLEQSAVGMFDEDFRDRMLPFDSTAARAFARIAAQRRQAGRPITQIDAQIAAITHACGARLATRNVADFTGCGIRVIDPWNDQG